MIVESTPPLRNAPSGTSDTRRRSTADVTSVRSVCTTWRSIPSVPPPSRPRQDTDSCQKSTGGLPPVTFDGDDRAGFDLADTAIEGPRAGNVAVEEVRRARLRDRLSDRIRGRVKNDLISEAKAIRLPEWL